MAAVPIYVWNGTAWQETGPDIPASPLKISAGPAITLYGATILESNSFRGKVAVVNETNSPVDLASTFPGTTTAVYPKLLGYALKKFEPREYKTTIFFSKFKTYFF